MTGRQLIIYILENGLEDDPVFKDGKFIGFMTAVEAAQKMNVGVATIFAWWSQGIVKGIVHCGMLYIPANFKLPSNTTNGGTIT